MERVDHERTGPGARTAAVVAVLCGIQFVDVLGVTSGVTALPQMLAGVGASPAVTPVLATAYAACFGGLLVVGGRLGDRHGHRRVLLLGTLGFCLAGVLGATSGSAVQLVAARALQGATAALCVPAALRLLLDAAPLQPRRGRALAAWSASGAAAGAAGFLVGGALTTTLGWQAVFWVNVPVGLLLLAGVRLLVPAGTRDRDVRVDLAAAALLVGAVMAVIVGASAAEQPSLRGTGAAVAVVGLVLGAALVAHQRRSRDPLVPRAAVRSANLRTGTAFSWLNTATTSSIGVLATLHLQDELDLSAAGAGLTLLPFSLGVVLGSSTTPSWVGRVGPRRAGAVGLALVALGCLPLVLAPGSPVVLSGGVLVCGTGLGIASVCATTIGTDVPEELTGTAGAVVNTAAQLGTALGVAALVLLAAVVGPPAGTVVGWVVAAALALAGAALLVRPRPSPRGR